MVKQSADASFEVRVEKEADLKQIDIEFSFKKKRGGDI
jgi:hypothetical protein